MSDIKKFNCHFLCHKKFKEIFHSLSNFSSGEVSFLTFRKNSCELIHLFLLVNFPVKCHVGGISMTLIVVIVFTQLNYIRKLCQCLRWKISANFKKSQIPWKSDEKRKSWSCDYSWVALKAKKRIFLACLPSEKSLWKIYCQTLPQHFQIGCWIWLYVETYYQKA